MKVVFLLIINNEIRMKSFDVHLETIYGVIKLRRCRHNQNLVLRHKRLKHWREPRHTLITLHLSHERGDSLDC